MSTPRNYKNILDWLVEHLADMLLVEPDKIDIRQTFESYGLSSREAVMLSGDLEDWLGCRLEPTIAWEYPTIEALAGYLDRIQAGMESGEERAQTDSSGLSNITLNEPIAIVGIGCRFPGANGPEEFWNLLRDGVDAITEVPSDRWDLDSLYDPNPGVPGKIVTRFGGFLEKIDEFDPHFFGISPREAERMDPQQRILLEVTWEALEDAGIPPNCLAGSKTGVFVGISTMEYGQLQLSDPNLIDAYAGTGNALSIAANRLSYFLDLHGPSMAVDTACSSSLLAVHLACRSIWQGETPLALAGGVSLMLSPTVSIAFTKAGLMAPDGRSKTFDAKANGYVRGEGAGIVVLKPLSKAIEERDRIYAVIRSSAVVHDGRSNGLMAPNPEAQKAVLHEAYQRASIFPGQIQYVETHGTGTYLGDPIEANALGEVLAEERPDGSYAAIGSVKTNIGHLEAAAGVAGLIKVALSLHHRTIPPSLNFEEPNPNIHFDRLPIHVQTTTATWPTDGGSALAGLSSFGFGGTNVHAVLEGFSSPAETQEPAHPKLGKAYLLPLTAKDPGALDDLAKEYHDILKTSRTDSLVDFCYSATLRRSHHPIRLACVGRSCEELTHGLSAHLKREVSPGLYSGVIRPKGPGKIVFVFSGQGAQWIGMGKELMNNEPIFREALEACDVKIREQTGWSLLEFLVTEDEAVWIEETDIVQPALFAIQIGLATLWRAWGVKPDAVVGHSMGEVAAAYIASALSLEDAVQIICKRSRLMKQSSGKGAMLATGMTMDEANRILAGYEGRVSIAVSNSLVSTVLSGEPQALEEIRRELTQQNILCRYVRVNIAYHSPAMEPLRDILVSSLEGIQPRRESIPIYSTVTGQPIKGSALEAGYWGCNLREPVQFSIAIQRMLKDGYDTFLEISPHPILASSIQQCFNHIGAEGNVISSLRREEPEQLALFGSLAGIYTLGYPIDWDRFYPSGGRLVYLPPYPWQRQRYWLEQDGSSSTGVSFPKRKVGTQETTSGDIPHDWLYQPRWQPLEHRSSVQQKPEPQGSWLIFSDGKGVGEALVSGLRRAGVDCIQIKRGKSFQVREGEFQVRHEEPEDFHRLADLVLKDKSLLQGGVVHLWSLDAPHPEGMEVRDLESAQSLGVGSAVNVIQSLFQPLREHPSRIWLVTQGAQPVGEAPCQLSPAQAPLWGLGRTVAQEEPAIWGGLIDLSPASSTDQSAEQILGEILQPDGEDQIAFRNGERYVLRLEHRSKQLDTASSLQWRKDASYLITGGLGGLGLELARWMVSQGARRLILMGRTVLPPRLRWGQIERNSALGAKVQAVRELEAMGASVHLASVDVADESQLRGFLEQYRLEGWPPIRGVFHLAGEAEGKSVQEIDRAELTAVMRPKVTGAWLLHRLFSENDTLDYFVFFSSATALFSLPFHGSYAAANAYLDTLAHFRRAQDWPALSINWSAWSNVGMANRFQREHGRELTPRGMESITPNQGLMILNFLLSQKETQIGVMNANWPEWAEYHPVSSQSPFLAILANETPLTTLDIEDNTLLAGESRSVVTTFYERLMEAPIETHPQLLQDHLQNRISMVLQISERKIPTDRNVMELGLDSIMVMELVRMLEQDLRIRVYPREVFERPSIRALAEYLVDEIHRSIEVSTGQRPLQTQSTTSIALANLMTGKKLRIMQKPIIRNPGIVLLISAPRSGSTLLRVMLAGHPNLFSPPELHLLPFESMRHRSAELELTYLSEGLQRAFMELLGLDAESGKKFIQDLTEKDATIQDIYARLQELASPRLLVDKSPSYAANIEILKRAEALFKDAKYIHIVRHPYSVIESSVHIRLEKLLGMVDVDPYIFAEQIWTIMNDNILEFSNFVNPDRYFLMRYEDLVKDPGSLVGELCNFLGIPFVNSLLDPYHGNRMADGIYPESMPIGDPNFLKHDSINPSLGEKWKVIQLPNQLGEPSRHLATHFQYELPWEEKTISRVERQNAAYTPESSAASIMPVSREKYRVKESDRQSPENSRK